jgi:UDP-glucuronate 4-epimerase
MRVLIFGNGQSRRDYTYVDDIVSGIRAAMRLNLRYGIFNLGESAAITLLDLICALEEAMGMKAKLKFLPYQAGDMLITYADISRSCRVLGYDPKVPVHDGIKRFANWFLKSKAE